MTSGCSGTVQVINKLATSVSFTLNPGMRVDASTEVKNNVSIVKNIVKRGKLLIYRLRLNCDFVQVFRCSLHWLPEN